MGEKHLEKQLLLHSQTFFSSNNKNKATTPLYHTIAKNLKGMAILLYKIHCLPFHILLRTCYSRFCSFFFQICS